MHFLELESISLSFAGELLKIQMRKQILSLFGIATWLLFLSACGETEKKQAADLPIPDSMQVLNQTPAAEILGSTVTRHLRFQSEAELKTVLEEPDQLLNYISGVSSSFRHQIGKIPMEEKQRGSVFVGVKADGSSKLWYVFNDRQPSEALKGALRKGINAVKPIEMKQGMVVFGVALSLWGYKETMDEEHEVIIPKEWTEAGKKLGGSHPASKLAAESWELGD